MSRRTHHVLPNSLPLIVTSQGHLHGVCIALAVRCGARNDTLKKWGLSHFVEHMMFRGSRQHQDAAALIAPFERGGGTLNAETWRDHTMFWTVVHPKHVEAAMAALGDMMAHPRFADMELERLLVQSELDHDIDDDEVDTDIGALSRSNIWGAHPMGRRIVGSQKSLLGLTKLDVRRRHHKAYVARNMALSVAGRITAPQAHALARKYFGAIQEGESLPATAPPRFGGKSLWVSPQPVRQVSVQWTFEALPDGHPLFAAQSLLVALLDDGMGTRLHRALSEKSGLVYAFGTGLDCYTDCGLYDIDMQVEPKRLPQALAQTAAVLKEVALGAVGAEELEGAKQRALLAMDLAQDSAEDTAQEAAVDLLFGRPSPAQHREALRRTTCATVQQLAHTLFVTNRRALTLVGATHKMDVHKLEAEVNAVLAPEPRRKPALQSASAPVLAARRTRAGRCTKATPQR